MVKYKKENKNDPNYKNIIKDYKRRSRHIQRKNIKLLENKNYVHIDKIRKEKDKDKFWRKLINLSQIVIKIMK
jgi:hypothetical protein